MHIVFLRYHIALQISAESKASSMALDFKKPVALQHGLNNSLLIFNAIDNMLLCLVYSNGCP
jgi:hypothetical protein